LSSGETSIDDRLLHIGDGVDPAALREALSDVAEFVRRFVVASDDAIIAIALWIVHTHAIDAADATPYLQITSPQKQCGKSRLLEVLELLVARPWATAKTSAAALVRKIAKDAPTLLLDETDAAFGGEKEYAEALRGILNAGHRRGGVASLCVGKSHAVEDFPVFAPKALAGIGTLPDTIADRSIQIELQRRLAGEPVHRLRRRLVGNEADALRARVDRLAQVALLSLRDAQPMLPDELSDRAQDAWESLLAIADLAGAGDDARRAAVALSASRTEEEDVGVRCLRDIREIFAASDADRITSASLVEALRAIEEGPYGPHRGREFDARALAKRLKVYNIRPDTQKFPDGKKLKGYMRSWFEDAWSRYLAPSTTRDNGASTENTARDPWLQDASVGISPDSGGQRGNPYGVKVSSVISRPPTTDDVRGRNGLDHADHADHALSGTKSRMSEATL